MRISDCSSDVCSSDLKRPAAEQPRNPVDHAERAQVNQREEAEDEQLADRKMEQVLIAADRDRGEQHRRAETQPQPRAALVRARSEPHAGKEKLELPGQERSEEHKSEIQ